MNYLIQRPLRTALALTGMLLLAAAGVGWLLAGLSGAASLTIESDTEFVAFESVCTRYGRVTCNTLVKR